ncbi:MAG TPA: M67 family metallopeptidase [Anaerolineae bacterium]|nr:M67 family metallopeptidase [Anaerolineae bacterium]HMR63746.1 M67 family metallopeptidase [Anaerolineae bacterium]
MKITDALLKEIYAHAKETYPAECCGFLVGQFEQGGLVRQVRRATNQNTERNDRFIISGEEYAQTQFAADEAGLEIIGLYHSHPDWPPIPSQTDMDSAWEEIYYLITSVHDGMPLNTSVWRLAGEGMRRFQSIALEILDENEL